MLHLPQDFPEWCNHSRQVHDHEETECEICRKVFMNEMNLKEHSRQVHDNKEAECEMCHKIRKNEIYFNNHVRNDMSKEAECQICHKIC